jgi:hypothetical protein
MIKHVVLMKFKPGASEARFADLEAGLGALPNAIPEIKTYEFGLDVVRSDRSYDFGLVSSFEDLDALQIYQTHPDHLEVVKLIKELCEKIVAVDFTC